VENTLLRTRYGRSNAYYKKRKAYAKIRERFSIKEIIAKQTVISIFIFILLFTIESIDTSVTNYLSDNIRLILQQDIDINAVINKTSSIVYELLNGNITSIFSNDSKNMQNTSSNTSSDLGNMSNISGNVESMPNIMENIPVITENMSINQNDSTDFITLSDINNSGELGSSGVSDNSPIKFIAPVKGEISSPFGPRIDPITQTSKFHYGLDIDTEKGTLVQAAADGEVLEITEDKMYGKNIKIKHPDGTITVYAHCSKIYQIEGNKVNQGDIIAEVGDTGYSTGTHLHFEIWKNGEALDPALYVDVEQ